MQAIPRLLMYSKSHDGIVAATSPQELAQSQGWGCVISGLGPWSRDPGPCGPVGEEWWKSSARQVPASVVLCGACSSSLDVAWDLAAKGCLVPFDSVLALSQWAGRGQLRRQWVSPPGNIHAAWLWPRLPAALNGLSSLVAGYVLTKALADLGVGLSIKWPNDLLLEGRKVGGILVEERGSGLMIGVGLNLNHVPPEECMRENSPVQPGRLLGADIPDAPPLLWLELVNYGLPWYESCSAYTDPGQLSREIEKHMAFIGQRVLVTGQPFPACTAIVLGLTREGKLRLNVHGREMHIQSGSISSC